MSIRAIFLFDTRFRRILGEIRIFNAFPGLFCTWIHKFDSRIFSALDIKFFYTCSTLYSRSGQVEMSDFSIFQNFPLSSLREYGNENYRFEKNFPISKFTAWSSFKIRLSKLHFHFQVKCFLREIFSIFTSGIWQSWKSSVIAKTTN